MISSFVNGKPEKNEKKTVVIFMQTVVKKWKTRKGFHLM